MSQKSHKISEIYKCFPNLFTGVLGNTDVAVDHVSPPEGARKGSLVFVSDGKFKDLALSSAASAVVLSQSVKSEIEQMPQELKESRAFLFSGNVKLAMALVKSEYFAFEMSLQEKGKIHRSAAVDPSAKIGSNVTIGAYSVIGANVVVEEGAQIDASVVVEADSKIGKNSHLYSQLYIGPRTQIGENCILMPQSTIGAEGFGFAHNEKGHFYRIPQTGNVVLGNNVEIGSQSTIDRATFGSTVIGDGTKIDKQCHIAHNCQIGKHCVIAASFAVAGSTKIGNHCIFGGRVTMRDGITVCDGVELAAASGVHNNITEPGKYGGHPLQPVMDSMRTIKSMAHLPRMRKQISKLFKHLNIEEENLN